MTSLRLFNTDHIQTPHSYKYSTRLLVVLSGTSSQLTMLTGQGGSSNLGGAEACGVGPADEVAVSAVSCDTPLDCCDSEDSVRFDDSGDSSSSSCPCSKNVDTANCKIYTHIPLQDICKVHNMSCPQTYHKGLSNSTKEMTRSTVK